METPLIGSAAAAAPAISIETVRSDLSDGKRKVKVMRIRDTKPVFFKAKMAIDADGAARAYHPDNIHEALDRLKNATGGSKKFIQGKKKNGVVGKGPRPGFFVSETALSSGEAFDAGSFVDAEFIPYIVLPSKFVEGVKLGDLCTVVNLKNFRATGAIVADTNPHVGEASVRTAINLHVHDTSFPITELAKNGGDTGANYLYIVYPGSRVPPRQTAPYWPAETITEGADAKFAEWGGIDMVKRVVA
jgi:hypothetical protein